MPTVHVLHIPKTGGTAIKAALSASDHRQDIILHGHGTTIRDITSGEPVIFAIRNPISRFVSSFYSRYRQGRPRYNVPWDEGETAAFNLFSTPNALAEALTDLQLKCDAQLAMKQIRHVNKPMCNWVTVGELEFFRKNIIYISRQEVLDQDFKRIRSLLKLPAAVMLPTDHRLAHKMPAVYDVALSEHAISNLRSWFRNDMILHKACLSLRRQIIEELRIRHD